MAKTLRIQVLMDPRQYIEAVNQAQQYKIKAKNDSQLLTRIVELFLNEIPANRLFVEQLKQAIDKKNAVISDLQEQIQNLKLQKLKGGKK